MAGGESGDKSPHSKSRLGIPDARDWFRKSELQVRIIRPSKSSRTYYGFRAPAIP